MSSTERAERPLEACTLEQTLLGHDAFGRLCRARELLREVREQRLSIPDTAREAGMSPFHFIRRFESLFGLTPHQFRIQARLDDAKLLSARGQHNVTEFAWKWASRA